MKLSLIIVFFIALVPITVFAAHIVPGAVPSVPPLQSLPAGVGPNASHNIEDAASQDNGVSSSPVAVVVSQPAATTSQTSGHVSLWWLVAVLAVLTGVGVVVYKKSGPD